MDIHIEQGQWGVWGDSTPPGWREGWDWTQGGEPCREDPGHNDFSRWGQLGCDSDDTREGAAVGERCAKRALTLTQCLVLAQSPALAKDKIWYLQLHSHIQGVEHSVTLTVLSDPATGWDCLHNHGGKPHHQFGLLWRGTASPGGGGSHCYVEQTPHALWLQNRYRAIHASQLLPVSCGTRDLIPVFAGIIQQIRAPLNTLLDEDAMGKNLYVWGENCSGE